MLKIEVDSLNTSIIDFRNCEDNCSEIEDDNISQNSLPKEILPWDAFKYFPLKKESASMQNKKWFNVSIRIIKVLVYGILFCTVLCSGLIAKFVVFFAISQLKDGKSIPFCNYYSEYDKNMIARMTKKGKIIWTWYIIFMFLIPECLTISRAIWYFLFKKKVKLPRKQSTAILFILETFHPIGIALLTFYSLPNLNSIDAAAISSCVCFIPTLLNLFTQYQKYTSVKTTMFMLVLVCNIIALIAQGSGVILQLFVNYTQDPLIWILLIALLLSSCRWWCNYVDYTNCCGFLNFLARSKTDLMDNSNVLQGYVAFWRCLIFISSAIVISYFKEIEIQEFFKLMWENEYYVELIKMSRQQTNFELESVIIDTITDTSVPFYSFLIQAFFAFFTYKAAKFAYQTQMHKFGFALPMSLVTPGTVLLIMTFCIVREEQSCALHDLMPDYLFLNAPNYNTIKEFLLSWRIWCWIVGWLSQMWITVQIWLGENDRLAPVEKIFYNSSYDSFLIDQFLGLNKRRHENYHVVREDDSNSITEFETISSKNIQNYSNSSSTFSRNIVNSKRNSCITQIYACATMWHEDKEEMNQLIGSILRLDKDQCAMKVTQEYYKIYIKDYYKLETHVIFDDAFCCMYGCIESCDHNENETHINRYVLTFIETMQENIKSLGILDLPPIKCPTPYGGQLIWNLPGKTCLTVHLKDKNKIRHRKRWSQVMYMYYLLGYRLMGSSIDVDAKELIAENTYILTLDGDVDFRPKAVKALIDLMKKDKELGAACGRIHPIGKGPMIWFQKFEYAIGHWLQKATEHTIGSVLCSPGCFSLFRAKALMQHNVIAKYATKSTEPKHYIQYDQGEDRWLCTLILQAGCRVAYCAASDAYTHAPESFKEFYIQRRRWIPSTMANIFDLLGTSSETRKLNDNISWLYIAYQWILTGSTIIGPSFIYLMMVGAFQTSFQLDNWLSFWINSIPIVIFILVCSFCKVRMQLITAEVITIIYCLVMMVVLVGIVLQIASDGFIAPNALLFFIVVGQFVATAFVHPQEISCLPNGIVYYITVPSMYMLLIIFSIFNLHNITWGTRETKSQRQLPGKQSMNKSRAEQHDETTENMWTKLSSFNLFKCTSCICKISEAEEEYLQSIYNSINEINLRLKQIESKIEANNISKDNIDDKNSSQSKTYSVQVIEHSDTARDSEIEIAEQISTDNYQDGTNYLINPYWIQDERLKDGKIDFLSYAEEGFWKQLIKLYLHPIENDMEKQQKIAKGLIHIRDECLLKFFIINALFIVAIFLLQMNKGILHLQWPFSIEYNITYVDDYEIHIYKKYMYLEPIGCLFIVAFVFILLIQFLAMLNHRLNTFTHVLANVKLKLPCLNKGEYASDDLITNTHAKNIAEGLQNTIENQTIFSSKNNITYSSGKRKTVRELIQDIQNTPKMSSNLEVLFRRQLQEPNTSGFSRTISSRIPKGTMEAFERRRSNILAEHNKMQSQNIHTITQVNGSANHAYNNPAFLNDNDK
ncbi:chitin synthase chs-2 [Xylocopa sonorina]|uniref:chitin synthase chs-2 n=1 Tax=Xylocopa sonorina TaxID=1818115 RepID=UPI00403A90D7